MEFDILPWNSLLKKRRRSWNSTGSSMTETPSTDRLISWRNFGIVFTAEIVKNNRRRRWGERFLADRSKSLNVFKRKTFVFHFLKINKLCSFLTRFPSSVCMSTLIFPCMYTFMATSLLSRWLHIRARIYLTWLCVCVYSGSYDDDDVTMLTSESNWKSSKL